MVQGSVTTIPSYAEDRILSVVADYYYLTAWQTTRLLYKPTPRNLKRVQAHFKHLTDTEYCLADPYIKHKHRAGSAPKVYRLSRKAKLYLESLGRAVPYRVARTATEDLFTRHTLAVNDVLIALELFLRCHPQLTRAQLVHERVLKSLPMAPVAVDGRMVRVIPDGFFQLLEPVSYQLEPVESSVVLEMDMGSLDYQKRWREKMHRLLVWAEGPYRETFHGKTLTIATVCATGEARARSVRAWTEAELVRLGKRSWGASFLFTGLPAATTDPSEFFLAPQWSMPFHQEKTALLTVEGGAMTP